MDEFDKFLQSQYRQYVNIGGKLQYDEWREWYFKTFYTG